LAAPDLHINRLEEWPALADLEARVRLAAETAFGTGELRGAELSISFVPEAEVRALNRVYHGIDAATDVLAFNLGEVEGRGGSLLGDIYVCPDVARRSAETEAIEWSQEVLRLVIHAVLHLLGHDHPGGEERYESEMFRLQEKLLGSL
jgi:probable rRNA maturation factor